MLYWVERDILNRMIEACHVTLDDLKMGGDSPEEKQEIERLVQEGGPTNNSDLVWHIACRLGTFQTEFCKTKEEDGEYSDDFETLRRLNDLKRPVDQDESHYVTPGRLGLEKLLEYGILKAAV